MTDIVWTACTVTLGALKPWAANPRMSTKAQAKRILASFAKFGQVQAVAIGPENEVYDGHQRLSALLTIHGSDYQIDARRSSRALTDDERRALVVTLHAGAVGAWDWDMLAGWEAPKLQEWGLDKDTLKQWGADTAALATMLEAEKPAPVDAEPQIDRAEELREKWGVETGQLWQLGDHRLICGDCTDKAVVDRVMGGEKAGAVVTDPPYGIKWNTDEKGSRGGPGFAPIVGDDKPFDPSHILGAWEMVLWGGNYYADKLPPSPSWIVWDKRPSGYQNDQADCEMAWTNLGGPARIFRKAWGGGGVLARENGAENRSLHPTQKPLDVILYCLGLCSDCIVFDPYSGSGTTIIACERLGRKCRAVEISPAYVAVALERWADATGKTPVLLG